MKKPDIRDPGAEAALSAIAAAIDAAAVAFGSASAITESLRHPLQLASRACSELKQRSEVKAA